MSLGIVCGHRAPAARGAGLASTGVVGGAREPLSAAGSHELRRGSPERGAAPRWRILHANEVVDHLDVSLKLGFHLSGELVGLEEER